MSSRSSKLRAFSKIQLAITRFVRTRENAVRKEGLAPLQFQFISLVDTLHPGERQPNISQMAVQLGMQHHSAVELVDRLVERGFLRRERANHDRRHVLLALTTEGRKLLRKVDQQAYADVHEFAPGLLEELKLFLNGTRSHTRSRRRVNRR